MHGPKQVIDLNNEQFQKIKKKTNKINHKEQPNNHLLNKSKSNKLSNNNALSIKINPNPSNKTQAKKQCTIVHKVLNPK